MSIFRFIFLSFFIFGVSSQAPSFATGSTGRRGSDVTITVTGEPLFLNLSGGNGGNGSDGRDGGHGRCESSRDARRGIGSGDRRGENGRNGEDGGRGGSGGDATVIYRDRSHLRQVQIISAGGQGGRGGDGGRGGSGCPRGLSGRDGSRGAQGSRGRVKLVNEALLPLQEDTSRQLIPLRELRSGVRLTQQIWEEREGAYDLLAADSVISPYYDELVRYEQASALAVNSPSAQIDPSLEIDPIQVELSHGQVNFLMRDHEVAAEFHKNGSTQVIELLRFYRKRDFNSNTYKNITGQAGSRLIHFETLRPLIPSPALKLDMTVEVKVGWLSYRTLFSGTVSEHLIQNETQGYAVKLDQLPLAEPLLPGTKIRLTLNHHLQELDLRSLEKAETWVVQLE